MNPAPHRYGLLLHKFPASYIRPPFGHFTGELVLTERRMLLNVKRTEVGIGGMVMSAMNLPSYRPFTAFDLAADEIGEFKKGVYGFNKHLVDLKDAKGTLYRFTVPDFAAFENILSHWLLGNHKPQ